MDRGRASPANIKALGLVGITAHAATCSTRRCSRRSEAVPDGAGISLDRVSKTFEGAERR